MISPGNNGSDLHWYARQEAGPGGTDCGYEMADSADTNEGCAGHILQYYLLLPPLP